MVGSSLYFFRWVASAARGLARWWYPLFIAGMATAWAIRGDRAAAAAGPVTVLCLVVLGWARARVELWLAARRFMAARMFLAGEIGTADVVKEVGAVLDGAYAAWWVGGQAPCTAAVFSRAWAAYLKATHQAMVLGEILREREREAVEAAGERAPSSETGGQEEVWN